jgi:hypothetical protein
MHNSHRYAFFGNDFFLVRWYIDQATGSMTDDRGFDSRRGRDTSLPTAP